MNFIHILHGFKDDIPEYLSQGDIFSPKSKKLHFRHRKYILYKFMYNLFSGIPYGHAGSIHMNNA